MTIGTGVSRNRLVTSIADSQMEFLDRQAALTGLGRAHVVRMALALLQSQTERVAAIEADMIANESAC